jgi:uncharacterized protein with PIN domain
MRRVVRGYTVEEFIQTFRNIDGKGHIRIVAGNQIDDIPFSEILCDLCNVEIIPDPRESTKKVVFVRDSWAYCEDCAKKYYVITTK